MKLQLGNFPLKEFKQLEVIVYFCNFQLKEPIHFNIICYFQLHESPPPHNIPVPTPAPAHPLGGASGGFQSFHGFRGPP